jgi:ABC-type transport system involved in multi-copper enzyme maturation permease subunit
MQIRSLVFWLTTIVLLFFWYGEVFSEHQSQIIYSTAAQPIITRQPGGITIDFAANARAALQVANFSAYAGWLFADRVGLMSALFIGLLASFVFGRDRTYDLLDVVNSRQVKSWQYILGKYIGVLLTWALPLTVITVIEIGSVYQMCHKASLPFAIQDFIAPVFGWIGISLVYGIAVIMLVSLILKSGVGTLLIHFLYWAYSVVQMSMFQTANTFLFLTYWFFRLDTGLSPRAANLVMSRSLDLSMNRSLYAVLAVAILGLTARIYQVLRERGTWVLPPGERKKTHPWRFWSRGDKVDSDEWSK